MVHVWRGDSVESRHRGSAAVMAADGRLVAAWGDIEAPVYPRSAAKPLQAIPLDLTGAVNRFDITPAELAIACGSHAGEPIHVRVVASWLARLGLGAETLICGPHPPLSELAARALAARGEMPSRLHNNCSGKHAGFLTLARQLGAPVEGYGDPDHPVQRRVTATLAKLVEVDPASLCLGIDGCGVPTLALPLAALAGGFARLAAADDDAGTLAAAARRVTAAMAACPEYVAGAGRFDSEIIAASGGDILVKGGAEGVAAAMVRSRRLGLALKIDDGAKRGAEVAMAALLARFAGASPAQHILRRYAAPSLLNTQGRLIGGIRIAPGWLD